MLRSYLIIAWRNLFSRTGKNAATLINIAGLSLGMSAAVFIIIWVQNELNFDNYHPRAANIYYVQMGEGSGKVKFGGTPLPLPQAVKKQVPAIEECTQLVPGGGFNSPVLNINEQFFHEKKLAYVDSNWFGFFHYDFIEGSLSSFNLNPYSIILTESLAKKYFGTRTATGQVIKIDSIDYRVQALVKDNPSNSSFQYDIFLPRAAYITNHKANAVEWRNFSAETFIRIRNDAVIATVQKTLSNMFAREIHLELGFNTVQGEPLAAFVTPLAKMHFEGGVGAKGDKKVVLIFSVLGFLLLAVASINYVNMSTARASKRSKEVSVKKMMGAASGSLFAQFMIESVLTSIIALMLSLVIVKLALPWFNHLTDKIFTLTLSSLPLWKVLGGTLAITIVLTGIYPAFMLSSFKPLNVLRGNTILKMKDSSLRKALVTIQFTIAIALSLCTIVILRQLHFIQSSNDGYNRSQIFSFPLPNSFLTTGYVSNKTDLINKIKSELAKETAIENTTVSNEAIQNIGMSMSGIIDWTGKVKGNDPNIALLSVDKDFRKTFHLQLAEGRWYDAENASDKHNYILTETTVSMLGLKKPYVGQYFSVMNDTGRIIGIVKDFHFRDYHQKISAAVLLASPDMRGAFFVQARPLRMKEAVAATSAVFKQFYPRTPFEYKFMDDEFEKMYRSDTKTATLISTFAGITIFISCLGLFGLVSFVAEQRTKEIGIRKILGATIADITGLISKDFMRLVLLALLIACPLSWWAASKWLEGFEYRITISWWMFAGAGLLASFIASLTVGSQAVKAALANPAVSLKAE